MNTAIENILKSKSTTNILKSKSEDKENSAKAEPVKHLLKPKADENQKRGVSVGTVRTRRNKRNRTAAIVSTLSPFEMTVDL